jgi:deoxyribose-phosphate aldolase
LRRRKDMLNELRKDETKSSVGATKITDKMVITAAGKKLTIDDIAKMIDQSLLRPDMTVEEIREGCRIAKKYDVASICVKPSEIGICVQELKSTSVLITTVIGFPHGGSSTETKVFETFDAIKTGAVEVDMVLNVGRLISRDFEYVEKDIKAVIDAAHSKGAIVKVILENAYLTDELKEIACKICDKVGADFVKTSTGYAKSGATIPDLKLMRRTCSSRVRIKAAGGVRTLDSALAVRAVGAVRFGATATKAIIEEAAKREALGKLFEVDNPPEKECKDI